MLRARLLALGLNLGREVEVLQITRGLIIVGINGGRVALGRGISQKILAKRSTNRTRYPPWPPAEPPLVGCCPLCLPDGQVQVSLSC